jgi:hypothetical protein
MSNLNVEPDVLSIIQKITASDNFDLPACLADAAKNAAAEAKSIYIYEDRCSCFAKHFHEAVDANKIDWTAETVSQYDRAIDHFSKQ